MAATRLIALHVNKGKTTASTLKDRIDYAQNPDKTENGTLIAAYECDPDTAWREFDLSQTDYGRKVGREGQVKVIAYQIRQSFKPGEVTPDEANRIGYETAMRFTKGRHAFTVSTHTDRAHIHNHVIFNAVDLDSTGRWRNFFFSGMALQHLSDLICAEHGLSVIETRPAGERGKSQAYLSNESRRAKIRRDIDRILDEKPQDFEEILAKMGAAGYGIKRAKYTAVRMPGDKYYIRFRSLGTGYTEPELKAVISGTMKRIPPDATGFQNHLSGTFAEKEAGRSGQIELLVDIEKKLAEGKGQGYAFWAQSFNNKQQAKVLLFLQDNGIRSFEELQERKDRAAARYDDLCRQIREKENRLKEISEAKTTIIAYAKTRPVFEEYRKSGYSRAFLEAHREELDRYREAKKAFGNLPSDHSRKIKDLNAEYQELLDEVKADRKEQKGVRADMKQYVNAYHDVQMILGKGKKKELVQTI